MFEVEYAKSYDGQTLTATPVVGEGLPTLTLEVSEADLDNVVFEHRVRTLDINKPGITAFLFGFPGSITVVEHDGVVATFATREEALTSEREGELNTLLRALATQ